MTIIHLAFNYDVDVNTETVFSLSPCRYWILTMDPAPSPQDSPDNVVTLDTRVLPYDLTLAYYCKPSR